MIRPEQVYLAVAPVDMRWGTDRLSAYVQNALGYTPCDGSAYAFTNHRRSRIKLLVWDGTGVWLCQRRLHKGYFHWPRATDTVCCLKSDVWHWLISGVEWHRLTAAPATHWRV